MKFKDTIYSGRKLAVDAVCPETGEVIIPAYRCLTKKLILNAKARGIEITKEMLHDVRAPGFIPRRTLDARERRIAQLKEQIDRCEKKLKSLLGDAP